MEPQFISDLSVELIRSSGDDAGIAAAARVSTDLDLAKYSEHANAALINYLMRHRHGSPFEHNSMTFMVHVPIFVAREWMRHRVGWSYNEVSGRYTQLEPTFYVYPPERPMIQSGSSAHPNLSMGTDIQRRMKNGRTIANANRAWRSYQDSLADGLANEVARDDLPLSIYTRMYVTCNARSLMAFLSLRVDDEKNTFVTKPLWEIQQAAEAMAREFERLFPATFKAFESNGRVSP